MTKCFLLFTALFARAEPEESTQVKYAFWGMNLETGPFFGETAQDLGSHWLLAQVAKFANEEVENSEIQAAIAEYRAQFCVGDFSKAAERTQAPEIDKIKEIKDVIKDCLSHGDIKSLYEYEKVLAPNFKDAFKANKELIADSMWTDALEEEWIDRNVKLCPKNLVCQALMACCSKTKRDEILALRDSSLDFWRYAAKYFFMHDVQRFANKETMTEKEWTDFYCHSIFVDRIAGEINHYPDTVKNKILKCLQDADRKPKEVLEEKFKEFVRGLCLSAQRRWPYGLD